MSETDQIRRFVALYDQHYPFCIPEYYDIENPKRRTPILRFLRDFNPHIVAHGGDQLDLEVISFFNREAPRLKENKRLSKEYDGYNRLLDAVETATPKTDTNLMLEGNHEFRIERYVDTQPELEGMVEVPYNLKLKQRGYKWFPRRTVAMIGKLHLIHGDWKEGILPVNHTRAALTIYNRNLLYGHCHTNQSSTSVSPIDTHPMQATSVGTLAHVNPYWRRNDASSWVNSFACGYVYPDGNFQLFTVNIVDKRFTFDGVTYK